MIAAVALIYHAVDVGVTHTHQEQRRGELEHQRRILLRLCSVAVQGREQDALRALLRDNFPEEEPYVKEGAYHITGLSIALDERGRAERCELPEGMEP